MKKLNFPKGFVLTGTDNNGFRHRYSVKKNENFKKIFVKFMVDLGFEDIDAEELIKIKIKDICDECWHYENEKFDVDVFYGRFKIILVVRTKSRRPLLDSLYYKSKWIKPLKIKKIKKIKKKRIIGPFKHKKLK
jgi:hypothetical protein